MTTLPEPVALQFWSHQPITAEIRQQLEQILRGRGEQEPNGVSSDPLPAQTLSENPNIKQTKEGIWVLVNDDHISRWIEEHGQLQHDFHTLPKVLPEIPEGGTVIDVGANVGDTTGPFLERVGPNGTVLAFEPNMDAWECLKRNCPKAKCFQFALGAPGDPWLELAPNDNAGARHLRKFGFEDNNGPVVDIATLDSLDLEACDFIKIDVEGFELRVLKGAEQTINRFHPKMLIELNEGALQRQGTNQLEVCAWLQAHGYKWWPVQANLAPDSPQYDILCVHLGAEWRKAGAGTVFTMPDLQSSSENKVDTIRSLASQLQKFCGNSAGTRLVRFELHKLGVIELPYRFKRRKKWRKRKAKA